MNRGSRIAAKIVADDTSVDWGFDLYTFFLPTDDRKDFSPQQKMAAKAVLGKVLDWSGGDMIRMLRKNIKSHAGLMNDLIANGIAIR